MATGLGGLPALAERRCHRPVGWASALAASEGLIGFIYLRACACVCVDLLACQIQQARMLQFSCCRACSFESPSIRHAFEFQRFLMFLFKAMRHVRAQQPWKVQLFAASSYSGRQDILHKNTFEL